MTEEIKKTKLENIKDIQSKIKTKSSNELPNKYKLKLKRKVNFKPNINNKKKDKT
jgi:hypothetical protein